MENTISDQVFILITCLVISFQLQIFLLLSLINSLQTRIFRLTKHNLELMKLLKEILDIGKKEVGKEKNEISRNRKD